MMHPVWIIKQLAISVTSCFKTPTFHFGVAEEETDGPLQRLIDMVNTKAAMYNATHEQETAMVADSDARRSGVYWGRSL